MTVRGFDALILRSDRYASSFAIWGGRVHRGVWVELVDGPDIFVLVGREQGAEEACEFGRLRHCGRDVVCSFVCVEASQDRHFVPFPGVPGVDWAGLDQLAVDDGLESPADGGVVSVEDGARGVDDG